MVWKESWERERGEGGGEEREGERGGGRGKGGRGKVLITIKLHTYTLMHTHTHRMTEPTADQGKGATPEGKKCYLCESPSSGSTYSKPSAWSKANRDWVNSFRNKPISPDVPICRACEKFIKRHTGIDKVTPRWFPKKKNTKKLLGKKNAQSLHTPALQ